MNPSENPTASLSRVLLRFLGSMNLAITLLVAIAIAAVIGTVLQQNQPYPDYVLKFGPFWFEVFKSLDLYNVYSSAWFLTILGFLVVSTSICIYRNMPRMIDDIRDYKEDVRRRTLQNMEHHAQWETRIPLSDCRDFSIALLQFRRYRLKCTDREGVLTLAAKKGAGSRLGYLFTHLAIVMICIGGLLDGNVPLKIAELRGNIRVENRGIPASEVPEISTLPADNLSFRANVSIPEGKRANLAFIDYKDGYLVQQLPFMIEVVDFRVEQYTTGQPKSFESDLIIYDEHLDEPIKSTISVNHPFSYRGYTVYQSSFGDGGSLLTLKLWPLQGGNPETREINAVVQEPREIETTQGKLTLELSDFRPFNINPDPLSVKKFRNLGPSYQFKLRRETGEAVEFINYMLPIEQNVDRFYMSGMRSSPAEDFRYWHIPADANDRLDRFMAFAAMLKDPDKLEKIALKTIPDNLEAGGMPEEGRKSIADFLFSIAQQFSIGGIDLITAQILQSAPEERRQEISELYAKALQHFLQNVYIEVLREEGADPDSGISDFDARFFDNAVNALSVAHQYASPFYLSLIRFEHREAAGLQITRSPGEMLVFPGCVLLAVGVFLMFYMPQRRIWMTMTWQQNGLQLLLSGSASRSRYDFDREFESIRQELINRLG
ncbi:MAG: cytochrome c biogenesis protein ResB [Gammaproteobacteria bacterium]